MKIFTILRNIFITAIIAVFTLTLEAQVDVNTRTKWKPKRKNNVELEFRQVAVNRDGSRSIITIRDTLFYPISTASQNTDTYIDTLDIFNSFLYAVPSRNPRQVKSVLFKLRGPKNITNKDRRPPYSLSKNNRKPFNLSKLPLGTYTLTATPFARRRVGGISPQPDTLIIITFPLPNPNPDETDASASDVQSVSNFKSPQEELLIDNSPLLEVFPNPSNGIFNILWREKDDNLIAISIFSTLGQVIYHRKATTGEISRLDLQHLEKGMYFVKMVSGNQTLTQKLIIQ